MTLEMKHRIELSALVVTTLIAIISALKAFIFLPPKVEAQGEALREVQVTLKEVQAKASATDVAIARMEPQLASINQGIFEIKADMRDLRLNSRE